MRKLLANTLAACADWLRPKAVPQGLTGAQWTGTQFVDAYRRNRAPSPNELLAELKNVAFACASINAAVCATYRPRLYVATRQDDATPKCPVRPLRKEEAHRLKAGPSFPAHLRDAGIDEVKDHPLLTLFKACNPVHNAFDLWELTTFYQETIGSAYWLLQFGTLGTPSAIWILPAQNVTPKRDPQSRNLIDYYEYRSGMNRVSYKPQEIIHFRYPDPKDPYTSGLSPLRAAWEQCAISSDYLAFKKATWENSAVPGAVISPDEVIGEEERDRLEAQWNAKFRRGGAGRALIAESGMKVSILAHSMGDLHALAEYGATKEDICNAFHVPMSYFTKETNLANLQAADYQHMKLAISPRLERRDEKINEQLIPLFDSSRRLFVASEDPIPQNQEIQWRQFEMDLKYGIMSVNEVRADRGLPPVDWGETPWLPLMWAPTDLPNRPLYAPAGGDPEVGRNRPAQPETPGAGRSQGAENADTERGDAQVGDDA